MVKKAPLLFLVMLLVLVSLSCTNPITMYQNTQAALNQTATAKLWTPTPTFTSSNTPTNTPTDTPTFTPTPDYLFFDDFEDDGSGWLEDEDESVLRGYSDGAYRILIKEADIFAWARLPNDETYSDVRIEVDAMRVDGPDQNEFGVMCRYQDNSNFYALEVTSDGYALIFKYEDGDYTGLSSEYFEEVDGINPDDWNKIVAVCDGENLELYANDELVASAVDDTFGDGEIALVAGDFDDGGADIIFDNLYVREA
jgi:hypothetical protein